MKRLRMELKRVLRVLGNHRERSLASGARDDDERAAKDALRKNILRYDDQINCLFSTSGV